MTHSILVVGRGLELDRERAVRAVVVLADEAVSLKPAGKSGLGDRDTLLVETPRTDRPRTCCEPPDRHERALGDLGPVGMEMHPHARLELVDPKPGRRGARALDGLDEMIGRWPRSTGRCGACTRKTGLRPLYFTATIRVDALRVVDLATDLVVLHELADRNHPVRSRDKPAVRHARRALQASPRSRR